MQCPRCARDVEVRTIRNARVSVCPGCKGMFLDHGELNKVAEPTEGDLEFSTLDLETFQHQDAFGPTPCPRCDGVVMKKVEFNMYTNIILDHCDSCRGFWLDGPELDRINGEVRKLNAASGEAPTPPMLWFAYFIWSLPH